MRRLKIFQPLPIVQRLAAAFKPGIKRMELMRAIFPESQFPRAWRPSGNGGPPGCAMAFGAALRKYGYRVNWDDNTVWKWMKSP